MTRENRGDAGDRRGEAAGTVPGPAGTAGDGSADGDDRDAGVPPDGEDDGEGGGDGSPEPEDSTDGTEGVATVPPRPAATAGADAGRTGRAGGRGADAGGLGARALRGALATGPPRGVAARLSAAERLPTALRAVLAHYAESGRLDVGALSVRRRAEAAVDRMVADAYAGVEAAVAEEFDRPPGTVAFDYDTKLLLPAVLTLARLYREAGAAAPDGFDPVRRGVTPGVGDRLVAAAVGRLPGVDDGDDRSRPGPAGDPVLGEGAASAADDVGDGSAGSAGGDAATGDAAAGVNASAGEARSDGALPSAGRTDDAAADDVTGEFSALVRDVERAERVTRLVVVALLDGDVRDAVNDREFGDFAVNFPVSGAERRRVAEAAGRRLRADLRERFRWFPGAVERAHARAVEVSEDHQRRDPHFRALARAAGLGDGGRDGGTGADAGDGDRSGGDGGDGGGGSDRSGGDGGDGGAAGSGTDADVGAGLDVDRATARRRVRAEYRDAPFPDPPAYLADDTDLPYLRTQYGRVGVIYEGMVGMYRGAGVDLSPAFERAVVLAIVGAQVWLDDVDDFHADRRAGQLTPVTAEYLLADSDAEAHGRVREVADRYFRRAREAAVEAGATLTAIAVEYIRRSGDPSVLPGSG